MIRAHKIRIYPTPEQEVILRQHIGGVRFVYNWGLERWNKWVEEKRAGLRTDNPNWMKLSNLWTTERPEWALAIPRSSVGYALKSINDAFTRHFRDGCGWPKFKKKGRCKDVFRSEPRKIFIRPDGWHIHITGVKKDIRMAERLRFSGKVLSYTVSCYGRRWYASALVEFVDTRTAPDSTVGVDVGMKTPAVCSDGLTLQFPKDRLQRLDKRLHHAQRITSRRKKESRRRAKALLRCQRIHTRILNIRRDCIHKFTASVCKNHATVVIEDLSTRWMHLGNKNIRKGMHKSSMSETLRQLGYKALHLVKADRFYPSTQLCSNCGARHKMKLTDRVYKCPKCGASIDRDLNAALNLSKYPGSPG